MILRIGTIKVETMREQAVRITKKESMSIWKVKIIKRRKRDLRKIKRSLRRRMIVMMKMIQIVEFAYDLALFYF